jgi:hypothetical protein
VSRTGRFYRSEGDISCAGYSSRQALQPSQSRARRWLARAATVVAAVDRTVAAVTAAVRPHFMAVVVTVAAVTAVARRSFVAEVAAVAATVAASHR